MVRHKQCYSDKLDELLMKFDEKHVLANCDECYDVEGIRAVLGLVKRDFPEVERYYVSKQKGGYYIFAGNLKDILHKFYTADVIPKDRQCLRCGAKLVSTAERRLCAHCNVEINETGSGVEPVKYTPFSNRSALGEE